MKTKTCYNKKFGIKDKEGQMYSIKTATWGQALLIQWEEIFLKMGRPLFHLFSSFCTYLVASRIRTRIVGVEGDDADH